MSDNESHEGLTTLKSMGTELSFPARMVDDAALREVSTMADVLEMLDANGIQMSFADEELGDGFSPWERGKDALVGQPMLILLVRSAVGDFLNENGEKSEFVIIRFVMPANDGRASVGKYFLTDGGTGIGPQLSAILARRGNDTGSGMVGLMVPHGLRKSEYDTEINGRMTHGITYYLDSRGNDSE